MTSATSLSTVAEEASGEVQLEELEPTLVTKKSYVYRSPTPTMDEPYADLVTPSWEGPQTEPVVSSPLVRDILRM